jgi:hypothetical protein
MEAQMTRPTTSKTTKMPDTLVKQRQHSISTHSEEMEEITQRNRNNDWQMIRRTKRKRLYNTQPSVQTYQTKNNKQIQQARRRHHNTKSNRPPTAFHTTKTPAHIHTRGTKLQPNAKAYHRIEEDQYFTKSLANNVIKLTCKTPDTYRSIVKHFKKHDIFPHIPT